MINFVFCDQKENFTKAINHLRKKLVPKNKKYSIQTFCGDIRKLAEEKNCAFISPANCMGFMDGGIDAVYMEMFNGIEEKVQTEIKTHNLHTALKRYYIPIGSSLIVDVGDVNNNQTLISAPTMWLPRDVSKTRNAYWAFRSILCLLDKVNKHRKNKITTVICPGLCTGCGFMPPNISATQILSALTDHLSNTSPYPDTVPQHKTAVIYEIDPQFRE